MTIDTSRPRLTPADMDRIEHEASVLMDDGMRLLAERQPASLEQALARFDEALALRRRWPADAAPRLRYDVAASWLQRADAISRLQRPAWPVDALESYDEALIVLRTLPLEGDPQYVRRLVIALQNRALVLLALTPPAHVAALAAYDEAAEWLASDTARTIEDRPLLSAVVFMNLANARLADGGDPMFAKAYEAAATSIGFVTAIESANPEAAEVGLKARHLLCQVLARRLSPRSENGEVLSDDLHEATDTVEAGLDLARHWQRLGVDRFRALGHDLFVFGALVYQRFQPQFLEEFVRDHADFAPVPSPDDGVGAVS